MASSHLQHSGEWADCPDETLCSFSHHLPMPASELQSLPKLMMLQLVEAFDPPSEIESDGTKVWRNHYLQPHRSYDLPAVISLAGDMDWYFDGMRHRDHGRPAIIHADGRQEWHRANKLHREDGPAVIAAGVEEWYYRGERRVKSVSS
jgi:hypothetical protein